MLETVKVAYRLRGALGPRRRQSAATMPRDATPAARKNANLYPATSASADSSPPDKAAVRVAARVRRAASPSAVPTCAEVFMKPEARPRLSSATAEVPRAVEATEAQPRPNPDKAAPAST